MSNGSKVLLVGLRGSGKTSYLAALWHLIEAGEIPSGLVASHLQPDREYLNRVRDSWLRFQEVGRTSLRNQEIISLSLRDAQTETPIDIVLPDLSGELFRLQWVTRRATRQYADFAAECSGVLLLIHSATVEKSVLIPLPTVNVTKNHLPSGQRNEGDFSAPSLEWSSNLTPTQVQLVELLQFVSYLRSTAKPIPIAVLISAWDLVRDPILPMSWLESHLPLLFQFLVANSETMPSRVYGISALGGDLGTDMEKLRQEPIPARRIKVVSETLEPHNDLTDPIRFLLNSSNNHSRSSE
jgi:hypothetical protein